VTLAACIAVPTALLAVQRGAVAPYIVASGLQLAPQPGSCRPAPLAVRAGAVLVVGLPEVTQATDPLIREVLDAGVSGVFVAASNVRTGAQLRALLAGVRAQSDHSLLVATDAESGRVSALRDVIGTGPSSRRLARERTPAQVASYASELGAQLRDLGVTLDLAPVLDLDDGRWDGVIGDRSFGTDPDRVALYAEAFRDGLSSVGVLAAVKHFPGQGRSGTDTHLHQASVDTPVAGLTADLAPFRRLIDAGAPVVMMSHLDLTALGGALPASLSPPAYALLRSTGFTGVAMTDSLGMGAVNGRWDFPEAAVRAIAAGADLAFATDGRQAGRMRDALVAAVGSGRLSEARLDEAVARVVRILPGEPRRLTCPTG
jgi:beta-N-acetylhexosaminidase